MEKTKNIRVNRYLAQKTKIFEHDDTKLCTINIPSNKGYVSTTFEVNNNQDLRAEILSSYKFEKGILSLKSYSDDPLKLMFVSPLFIPSLKTTFSIDFTNGYPAWIKTSYSRQLGKYTFKQNALIRTFFPPKDSGFPQNYPFLWLQTSTQFFNPLFSTRFEIHQEPGIVLLECFWKKYAIIGTSIAYQWSSYSLKNLQLVCGFSIQNAEVIFSSSFVKSAVNVSTNYRIDANTKAGLLFGFENIGHEADKVGLFALSRKLQKNSKIKLNLNSNQIISASYKLAFQNYLKMKFSGSLDWQTKGHYQNHFGAHIVFDLK